MVLGVSGCSSNGGGDASANFVGTWEVVAMLKEMGMVITLTPCP